MKTMVIIAHPRLAASRANRAFEEELRRHSDVTVRDLYGEYPNWRIDVEKEQSQLIAFDRIVLQFPFYWYGCPSLMKKWMEDVLTYGWAYGPGGEHLRGKQFIVATTTGGSEDSYRPGGYNWYTVGELLRPIRATLRRCDVTYMPEFVTFGISDSSDIRLVEEAKRYVTHIRSDVTKEDELESMV